MTGEHTAMTFLVVDDDSIFHFLVIKMLARIGIQAEAVRTASSGKEALDLIVESRLSGTPLPDFILLDLNMPIMGGFAFLEACRKLPEKLPDTLKIAIISSSLDKRDQDRALQLGARYFLIKPVTEVDLQVILDA
ncbi:MAG: response regulator [Cyclobacteriaceae bacterium]|nr:response regulator [Cyclobacteriaceae bacterium]